MPKYYFTTDDGDSRIFDQIGQELPDAAEARSMALDALPDMARDKLPDGDTRTFMVTVSDEANELIYKAELKLKGEWVKRP